MDTLYKLHEIVRTEPCKSRSILNGDVHYIGSHTFSWSYNIDYLYWSNDSCQCIAYHCMKYTTSNFCTAFLLLCKQTSVRHDRTHVSQRRWRPVSIPVDKDVSQLTDGDVCYKDLKITAGVNLAPSCLRPCGTE